jgi:hypothetical protein
MNGLLREGMKQPVPYKKLPGTATLWLVGSQRLWAGPDHLLMVTSSGYTEAYKRFAYRDIQGFVSRRTCHWALGLGLGGFFSALGVLLCFTEDGWSLGAFFLFFALPVALWNLVFGPTCRTTIRTAVQTEKVPSLSRARHFRKAMRQVLPRIQEAQGVLTPEEYEGAFREAKEQRPGTPPPVPLEQGIENTEGAQGLFAGRRTLYDDMRKDIGLSLPQRASLDAPPGLPGAALAGRGQARKAARFWSASPHFRAFVCLFASTALDATRFSFTSSAPGLAALFLGSAAIIFFILGLVKQYNTDLPGMIRFLTWAGAAFCLIKLAILYITGVLSLAINAPDELAANADIALAMARLSPYDGHGGMAVLLVCVFGGLAVSLPGLALVFYHRARRRP